MYFPLYIRRVVASACGSAATQIGLLNKKSATATNNAAGKRKNRQPNR